MACVLAAGCLVPVEPEAPAAEAPEALEDAAAARLRLESQYWKGLSLLAEGDVERGRATLRSVVQRADEEGVALPPEMLRDIERALSEKPSPPPAAPEPAEAPVVRL